MLASRLLLLVLFFGLWELLAKTKVVNPMLTSYPSALWPTFVELMRSGNLLAHTWATFAATLIGFALSMVFGVAIAAGLWWSSFANRVLEPFLVVANAMPKIAFVPIFYIWLGSNVLDLRHGGGHRDLRHHHGGLEGFRADRPEQDQAGQDAGRQPGAGAAPGGAARQRADLISAVKMNIGLSLVGVIVGEFQSASEGWVS